MLIVCVITKCRQVSSEESCYTGLSWQPDHEMTEQPMRFEHLKGGASRLLPHHISAWSESLQRSGELLSEPVLHS